MFRKLSPFSLIAMLCMLLSAAPAAHAAPADSAGSATTGPRVLLSIDPDTTFTRNSEGDILERRDGSLALVYTRFRGGDHDHSPADLVLRTSADGGQSWSEDRVIVPNEGGCNVMSVSLERLPSGEILLFYLRKESAAGDCTIYLRRSSDELKTLSAPLRVSLQDGYHVMNNARVLRTSKGRLIAPAILHTGFRLDDGTTVTKFSGHGLPFVYYSDDDGRSWKKDLTPLDQPPTTGVMLQENGVVELRDGRLWMYIRTDKGSQYGSWSEDGGLTWSKPEPTALASPLSPATIRRIPWTGDLLCIWNDHSGLHPFRKGKRTPLCAAISRDDGRTWEPSKVIESDPEGWYCYTSILFQENRALISYCGGDTKVGGLNRLKVTELPREWVVGRN